MVIWQAMKPNVKSYRIKFVPANLPPPPNQQSTQFVKTMLLCHLLCNIFFADQKCYLTSNAVSPAIDFHVGGNSWIRTWLHKTHELWSYMKVCLVPFLCYILRAWLKQFLPVTGNFFRYSWIDSSLQTETKVIGLEIFNSPLTLIDSLHR